MPEKRERLIYFDLLRGYLLFAIIVDHLQRRPNLFEIVTGGGRQWASAAEGFFFISGLMLGYVRGPQMVSHGTAFVVRKMATRTAQLYVVSVLLTLLFVFWAVRLGGNTGLMGAPELPVFNWGTVRDALTFRLMYGWTNFLGYYVVFLLMSIPALLLIKKGLWPPVLAATVGVYLVSGNNFYLSWQLLFIGGLLVGSYYPLIVRKVSGLPLPTRRWGFIGLVALSFLTYSASLFYNGSSENGFPTAVARYMVKPVNRLLPNVPIAQAAATSAERYRSVRDRIFDRQSLTWPRLFFFSLWFTTGVLLFNRYERLLKRYLGWMLLTYGKASLLTFSVHGVVVFWVGYIWPVPSDSIGINEAVTMAVLLGVLATVKICHLGYGSLTRRQDRCTSPSGSHVHTESSALLLH